MSENNPPPSKGFTIDWLVRGVLTKAGDALDDLTGRKWQPSSNLATSQIIERLKGLLDAEKRDFGPRGMFVPHNIRLKVEWETFGSESGDLLAKLERELTVALIDHINDCRYHTYAPIDLKVKTDYFTQGVKLTASFDDPSEGELELEIAHTSPSLQVGDFIPESADAPSEAPEPERRTVSFKHGDEEHVVTFEDRGRRGAGRTGDNDLVLDHPSVSKNHASLAFNAEGKLIVSDTGSTNGTFVDSERIEAGAAVEVAPGSVVKFGELEVAVEYEFTVAAE